MAILFLVAVLGWSIATIQPVWADPAPTDQDNGATSSARSSGAADRHRPNGGANDATNPLPGFVIEEIYTVPSGRQGSWVSLTVDDRGRLITSDQEGKLYRITVVAENGEAVEPRVETIDLEIGRAQGLLCANGCLYVMVNNYGEGSVPTGLYRVTDKDGDDQFDTIELLKKIRGGGEHGPHAIVLGPDQKSLYICAGNHTDLPELDASRVPLRWKEDLLLPRMWDARGHARGKLAPGGWIAKTDLDGKHLELICNGFRNAYDIAFNLDGELFTFDADMEWDIGSPWYRPTRICHVTSGAEFGWRSGTGKWPSYYADSLPAVVDVGPGSPTGVVFGTGARFPAKYQRALYACDWSYGVIYAVHVKPKGATYTGTFERFAAAAPLPATDLVVNPADGALYFTVGGRGAQSALYRVTYDGNESTERVQRASKDGDWSQAASRAERRSLEKLHQPDIETAVAEAWPRLSSEHRHIRFAARIAVEHQSVDGWQDRALDEPDPLRAITALIALARCGTSELLPGILDRLAQIEWDGLGETGKLDLLRAYQLAMARMGRPDAACVKRAIEHMNGQFPSGIHPIDHELSRVLIFLEAPGVVGRCLERLDDAKTQQGQIHYALVLRSLVTGWTLDQRREYLAWFHKVASHRGGMSFNGFLKNIRAEAIDSMTDAERNALAAEIKDVPKPAEPRYELSQRPVVKEWFIEELLSSVAGMKAGRDFENGRKMFAVGLCFRCHRVRGEGESIGPDLTGSGRRYNARDLLTAVIEPNQVISDQYRQTSFVADGKVITGRVVNAGGGTIAVSTDMLDPTQLTNIRVRDIEERIPSKVSTMPQGLLNTLNQGEILDLMAYLRSGGEKEDALFRIEARSPSQNSKTPAPTPNPSPEDGGGGLGIGSKTKPVAPLPQAHSHNDYLHRRPLFDALDHGFCGIEADIHRVGDELLVGHDSWMLRPERTLRKLYLEPLRKRLKANGGCVYSGSDRAIMLLVDIKTDGEATYELLRKQLAEFADLVGPPSSGARSRVSPRLGGGRQTPLASVSESPTYVKDTLRPSPLIVVVSGNRPREQIEQDSERRVGIDGRGGDLDSSLSADLLPLISDNWRTHFAWRGEGPMPDQQRRKLRDMARQAHATGRQLRFWATPENERVWRELIAAGVDWIGTDDLGRLEQFLRQP